MSHPFRKSFTVLVLLGIVLIGCATAVEVSPTPAHLELKWPASGEHVDPVPVLQWEGVASAHDFQVQVLDTNTAKVALDQVTSETVLAVDPPLERGKTYNWTVQARDINGNTLARADSVFLINEELKLVQPALGDHVGPLPALQWEAFPGTTEYEVVVVSDDYPPAVVYEQVTVETSVAVTPPLEPGEHSWVVRARDANGVTLAELNGSFLVKDGDPAGEGETPTSAVCASGFERRELREPYQRTDDQPRYALAADELDGYLAAMGVEALCVPDVLGAPFINADWDGATNPATKGHMLSIGFEDLYYGAGWSQGFLLYATYDFAAPTEYDTFATLEDREAVREGGVPEGTTAIEVDGVRGFVRFYPSPICFGTCNVFKTTVFPFGDDYAAVVYHVGIYAADTDWDALAQKLAAQPYPPEQQAAGEALDTLAASLRFR